VTAGTRPTTPALHWAITRSGTEMMNSGDPITGIDRRPLNSAGMDIRSDPQSGFIKNGTLGRVRPVQAWHMPFQITLKRCQTSYQQANLSSVKYCVLTLALFYD